MPERILPEQVIKETFGYNLPPQLRDTFLQEASRLSSVTIEKGGALASLQFTTVMQQYDHHRILTAKYAANGNLYEANITVTPEEFPRPSVGSRSAARTAFQQYVQIVKPLAEMSQQEQDKRGITQPMIEVVGEQTPLLLALASPLRVIYPDAPFVFLHGQYTFDTGATTDAHLSVVHDYENTDMVYFSQGTPDSPRWNFALPGSLTSLSIP